MRLRLFSAVLILTAAASPLSAEPVRLVLQITVDQLRGDMLHRHRDRFGEGGFKRLLDGGTYFANAHYETANTFTASGHAVLVTGADTSEHGMVANEWWDRASGRVMYCTADLHHAVIGEPATAPGMSPANLATSTLGDELVSAGLGRAFALAGKDRSAIIPAGHLGKAYWFSEKTGGFTTSTYYHSELPAWLVSWNAAKPALAWREKTWTPLRTPQPAQAATATNEHARPPAVLGRSFPHPLLARSDALFYSAFRFTPFLDELTARFARELIAQEKLGQAGSTDYLSISFSGHDYIGHSYGPFSLEYEDSLLRLDAALADLFASLDTLIGPDRVLIVLSADHGVDDIPEAARARGYTAGRIYPDKVKQSANAALRTQLGVDADLVAAFVPPGFYLDHARVTEQRLDPSRVENALAEHLRAQPGIAHVFTRTALLSGGPAETALHKKIQRSFHSTRSGDVVIVQDQRWYLYPDAEAFAAMHGSPYTYDTFVPILLCGPGMDRRTVVDPVNPAQIAPTLAALLQLKPPSGCSTTALLPGIADPPQR